MITETTKAIESSLTDIGDEEYANSFSRSLFHCLTFVAVVPVEFASVSRYALSCYIYPGIAWLMFSFY